MIIGVTFSYSPKLQIWVVGLEALVDSGLVLNGLDSSKGLLKDVWINLSLASTP